MRNKIIAIAALAGALGAPLAAQAQSEMTMGVARSGQSVVISDNDPDGITVEQRPAFREYVVRERVPTYTVPERVVVGFANGERCLVDVLAIAARQGQIGRRLADIHREREILYVALA